MPNYFAITIICISLVLGIFFVILFDVKNIKVKKRNKKIIYFIFEPKENRIILEKKTTNENINSHIFTNLKNSKERINLKKFIKNFSLKNKKTIISELENVWATEGQSNWSVSEKNFNKGSLTYDFEVYFSKYNNLVNGKITIKNNSEDILFIKKEELFKEENKFNIFISFYKKDRDKELLDFLSFEINKNFKNRKPRILATQDIVSVVFSSNNIEELKRTKLLLLKKMKKMKKFNHVLKNDFVPYCFVETPQINNEKELNFHFIKILFSFWKSNELKKMFIFRKENIYFNEFEDFKESIAAYIKSIEKFNFKNVEKNEIYNSKNKKVIDIYEHSGLEIDIKKEHLNPFIYNHLKEKLIDKISLGIKDKYIDKSKKIMIEINHYNLKEIINKISTNKIIFLVNFPKNENKKKIINFLDKVSKYNLSLAVRFQNFKNLNYVISISKKENIDWLIYDSGAEKRKINKEEIEAIQQILLDNEVKMIVKNPPVGAKVNFLYD